jgi:hypothetical protein
MDAACDHRWKLTNTRFGFIVFERCSDHGELRSYFCNEAASEAYREDGCTWRIVENAQTFQFDLTCTECGRVEPYGELMGFLYCTECMDGCPIAKEQRALAPSKTWTMVAFGFLDGDGARPIPPAKIDRLSDYFNQRRDTSRSRIKIVSFEDIEDFARCKGEFIHDVGMLATEPQARKPLLTDS